MIVEVILGDALDFAAPAAPAAFHVGAKALGTDLFGMAVETAVGPIHLRPLPGQSGAHGGIGLAILGLNLRLAAKLQLGHEHKAEPRDRHGEERCQKQNRARVHDATSAGFEWRGTDAPSKTARTRWTSS